MVTRGGYTSDAVQAAHSLILELMRLLGEYRDHIVLVGGWVPTFICPEPKEPHVGSMDIDLALNHRHLSEAGYRTILELLHRQGYEQGAQPYVFHKVIHYHGLNLKVEVDFLGGESGGTGRGHRTQKIQDIHVRKARGVDLAFAAPLKMVVEGELPGGERDKVEVRVASVVPFLVMKGMALHDRLKEKDAHDIYFIVLNYPGGLVQLAEEFKPYESDKLVREGLRKIADKFASVDHVGPRHVADFAEATNTDERDRLRRDAFERIGRLLELVGKAYEAKED